MIVPADIMITKLFLRGCVGAAGAVDDAPEAQVSAEPGMAGADGRGGGETQEARIHGGI